MHLSCWLYYWSPIKTERKKSCRICLFWIKPFHIVYKQREKCNNKRNSIFFSSIFYELIITFFDSIDPMFNTHKHSPKSCELYKMPNNWKSRVKQPKTACKKMLNKNSILLWFAAICCYFHSKLIDFHFIVRCHSCF